MSYNNNSILNNKKGIMSRFNDNLNDDDDDWIDIITRIDQQKEESDKLSKDVEKFKKRKLYELEKRHIPKSELFDIDKNKISYSENGKNNKQSKSKVMKKLIKNKEKILEMKNNISGYRKLVIKKFGCTEGNICYFMQLIKEGKI